MDLKETAARHLERIQPDAIALSHRIHANPELGFAEHEASRLVTEALSGAGFSVAQVAIGLLRQHISPASRIHGIITRGGEAPNVVPGKPKAASMSAARHSRTWRNCGAAWSCASRQVRSPPDANCPPRWSRRARSPPGTARCSTARWPWPGR